MCENPINIINPTTHYRTGLDQITLQVPCNECNSCRLASLDEWFLRAYGDYMQNKARNGKTVFVTLTYDNAHLPWVTLCGRGFRAFNYDDIKRFRKELRTYLYRKGLPSEVRYFICSEFGPKTHRPHYHALLFFPPGLCNHTISAAIRHCWHYGFIAFSKGEKGGMFVNSDKSIHYVSKYVTKSYTTDYPEFAQKVKWIKEHDEEKYKAIKKYLPKHFQSTKFGQAWILSQINENFEKAFTDGIRVYGNELLYRVPQYILNSCGYSKNEHGVRVLNEFGKRVAQVRFNDNLDRSIQNFKQCLSANSLFLAVRDEDFRMLYYTNVKDLQARITQLLRGRTYYDLAVFKLVYRNRCYLSNPLYHFAPNSDLYEMTNKEYNKIAKSFKLFQISARDLDDRDVPEGEKGVLRQNAMEPDSRYRVASSYTFNFLPAFAGFEDLLRLISAISVAVNKSGKADICDKMYESRRLNEFIYPNIH